MTHVVLFKHSLFSGIRSRAHQKYENISPSPPCVTIFKKCTLKTTASEEHESSQKQPLKKKKEKKKAFVYISMQVRRQPIIPKFTRRKIHEKG